MGILDALFASKPQAHVMKPIDLMFAPNSQLQQFQGSTTYQLLQHLKKPVMLIDTAGMILYTNPYLAELLSKFSNELKQVAPKFNITSSTNSSINDLLNAVDVSAKGKNFTFHLGKTSFQIDLIDLTDTFGTKSGSLVQWHEHDSNLHTETILSAMDQRQLSCVLDPEGNLQSCNKNWQHILGSNFIGQKIDQHFANSLQQQQLLGQLLHNAKQGKDHVVELQFMGSNHQQKWLAFHAIPQLDQQGNLQAIIGYAQDITEEKLRKIDQQGQMLAISRSSAVIEFDLEGIILTANDNFLQAMGYALSEIQGKHHRIFVTNEYRESQEYQSFWRRLNDGEFFSNEFLRIAKGGKEVWIQASYNPIFGSDGKPFKVVKYATDITKRKLVINEIKRVMLELADGNLTTKINQPFAGEFAELGQSITKFINHLKHTIQDISQAASTIQNAASEISTGSTDLSSRTEQQASNLEETASSMEELTGTTKENTNSAKQANALSASATEVAVNGGQLIEKVVTTMNSINESAQKISDIIGVIDGIAFQTNILALNAAVEAARAGEQGRGFAVVASEVRNLAQRSANAAKDIKVLISDSVTKIRVGNDLVEQSGTTMQQIVTSIKRVNDIMAEIAAASIEQVTGIEEINRAVNQMDEMTQQNAALVEESAAAAENLLHQADQLNTHVATFKFEDSSANQRTIAPSYATKRRHL